MCVHVCVYMCLCQLDYINDDDENNANDGDDDGE